MICGEETNEFFDEFFVGKYSFKWVYELDLKIEDLNSVSECFL